MFVDKLACDEGEGDSNNKTNTKPYTGDTGIISQGVDEVNGHVREVDVKANEEHCKDAKNYKE